jgi:hypothetical protein
MGEPVVILRQSEASAVASNPAASNAAESEPLDRAGRDRRIFAEAEAAGIDPEMHEGEVEVAKKLMKLNAEMDANREEIHRRTAENTKMLTGRSVI